MVAWKQYLKSFASFFELSLAPSTRQNKNIVILAKVGIHLLKTWIFTFVGMTAYLLFQATFQKNVVSSKAA